MSELNTRIFSLLQFIQDSVAEGLESPASKLECFGEADMALNILAAILRRHDEHRHATLALIGLFNISFVGLAQEGLSVEDPMERVTYAKSLFQ